MYIYLSIYLYIYIYIYIYIYVCVCVCVCLGVFGCVHACLSSYVSARVCVDIYLSICIYEHLHTHTHTHTHTYIYIYIYIYIFLNNMPKSRFHTNASLLLINSLKIYLHFQNQKSFRKPETFNFKSLPIFTATTIPTPLSSNAFK